MPALPNVAPVALVGAFLVGVLMALRAAAANNRPRAGRSWLGVLLLPLAFVYGAYFDTGGVRVLFLAAPLLTAAGVAVLAGAAVGPRYVLGGLLAAVGTTALVVAVGRVLPLALAPGRPVASVFLGAAVFGLGARLTALLTARLVGLVGRRAVSLSLACACLVPTLLAVMTPAAAFVLSGPRVNVPTLGADPVLWITGLALLLYAPVEAAGGRWSVRLLADYEVRPRFAAWLLASCGAAFVGTRLLAVLLFSHASTLPVPGLLVGLTGVAAVILGNLISESEPRRAASSLVLLATLFGPDLPALLTVALLRYPGGAGTVFAVLLSAQVVGGLVLPPLFESIGRRWSGWSPVVLVTGDALLLCGIVLTLLMGGGLS